MGRCSSLLVAGILTMQRLFQKVEQNKPKNEPMQRYISLWPHCGEKYSLKYIYGFLPGLL